jgi:hypothetical protein
MSTTQGGGNILADGLILCLDAANTKSYAGTGTVWTDLSRSGNNGALTNMGVTGFSSSNLGSIVFDGVDDYVSFSTITNNIYTIDFWYKMGGNNGTYGYFASSGNNGLAISEGGTINGLVYGQFYYWNGATNNLSIIPSTTNWNHICVIINTSTNNIQLYGNGNLLSNTTVTSMSTSISNIGRFVLSNNNFLNGFLSKYSIYNRALSASEVLQNYNATKGRYL